MRKHRGHDSELCDVTTLKFRGQQKKGSQTIFGNTTFWAIAAIVFIIGCISGFSYNSIRRPPLHARVHYKRDSTIQRLRDMVYPVKKHQFESEAYLVFLAYAIITASLTVITEGTKWGTKHVLVMAVLFALSLALLHTMAGIKRSWYPYKLFNA